MTVFEIKAKIYLLKLGFQPNLNGYHYLAKILASALAGMEILPLKFKAYATLSAKCGKSIDSIEKDIQNAVSAAWLKGDVSTLYGEFGETLDEERGKPTNKQFILTALDHITVNG